MQHTLEQHILILKPEKPENKSEEIIWEGTHCISLTLRGSCIEIWKAVELMGQLPISNPKKMVSSILPYHEKLLENCSGNTKGDKVPCRICKMNIDIKFMCCHVGYHIINDNLQSVCDFCVLAECSIELKKS